MSSFANICSIRHALSTACGLCRNGTGGEREKLLLEEVPDGKEHESEMMRKISFSRAFRRPNKLSLSEMRQAKSSLFKLIGKRLYLSVLSRLTPELFRVIRE